MYFLNYAFMCLYIGLYLYYQLSGQPMPDALRPLNTWVSWGFLAWGGFMMMKVVVDCLLLTSKGQMSAANAWNGVLLSVVYFLPTLLMSWFMLKEGFKTTGI